MRTANPLSKHQLTEVDGLSSKSIKLVCRERVWSSVKETIPASQTIDLRRADSSRRSSTMTRRRNNKHASSHKRCISSSGKKKCEILMSTNFSLVFNYTLILDDDKIVGNSSSDEDRQPEQASANRSRQLKKLSYQVSLPGTSMAQRTRSSRADPSRQSSSMTRGRNSKHTSSHTSLSSSSKRKIF